MAKRRRKPKRPDEFALIARYFAPLAKSAPGAFGLTDDAAALTVAAGRQAIVTTDALVAGVHFPNDETPQSVAQRLIGVNLSDLAAMGARPEAYVMAIALPRTCDVGWIAAFAGELKRQQNAHRIALVGGDTVATAGPLTVCLTAIGSVAKGKALRRNGARAGDVVYVSGTIGDATLGLKVLQGGIRGLSAGHAKALVGRYRRPRPRVRLGLGLVGLATAAIDVSDGLIADLGHIARASRCRAVVDVEHVPLSAAGRAAVAADSRNLERALTGGDDYELAFTAPPRAAPAIAKLARRLGLPLTPIGRMERPKGKARGGAVTVRDATGRRLRLADSGYRHF